MCSITDNVVRMDHMHIYNIYNYVVFPFVILYYDSMSIFIYDYFLITKPLNIKSHILFTHIFVIYS